MIRRLIFLVRGRRGSTSFLTLLLLLTTAAAPGWARVELKPCNNHVSPQKQIELGKKAAAQVYEQMPVLPDSSPVTQYVQSVGQKLAASAPGYPWPFQFHVVDAADINAFALPGGQVFVNLGTIQAAEDEAQLAAVMAHEISHVVLQHSVCNMEKEQPFAVIGGLGQLAARVVLGNGALGGLAQNTIGLSFGLGFLKMSRGDEKQADEEGAQILYDAGYDPRAMPQFFEVIEGKYGKGGAQFLSDHPNPGNRTEYISEEIRSFPRRSHSVTDTPQFRQIHQQVATMRAYTAKEIASGAWKHDRPNETVSTGIDEYNTQAGADATGSADLTAPTNWSTFNGDGFTMQVPSTWRALGNRESAMVAPPGGIGQDASGQTANLKYGVMTDFYTPEAGRSGDEEFADLLNQLRNQNRGMEPSGVGHIQAAGRTVPSVESVTPSANQGSGEHDWIVGIPSGDGLRYFVFVAPEADFARLRPTFERVLQSIRVH
jgi:Zn-dependent protease with chaperone function